MSRKGRDIDHLSPQEKRALLAELLRKKAAARERHSASASSAAPAPERRGSFGRFAISSRELEAEAVLDPAAHPNGVPFAFNPQPDHIFLSGATGFLGAFLLDELLEKTGAEIHCLVRCPDPEAGRQKILAKLESYLPGKRQDASRIVLVPGDLSEPDLGLRPDEFDRLAGQIDAIYHSAAMVNWIYSYEQLRPANVMGTQEILKLACLNKLKPLHYVSTLAVFPLFRNAEVRVVREDDPLEHGGDLPGGYTQTKWVAEKLVRLARERGLPASIYRPGLITGHSRTGAWNTTDFTCQMLKSWINAGVVPDLVAGMDMTPVDYVSGAIACLSMRETSLGQVFHLANPQPIQVQELYRQIRSFGYPLEPVPYDEWRAALIALAGSSQDEAVNALSPILMAGESEQAPQWVGGIPRFDCSNALRALEDTSIRCPQVDGQVLNACFSYLVRSGFLPAPQAAPFHLDRGKP